MAESSTAALRRGEQDQRRQSLRHRHRQRHVQSRRQRRTLLSSALLLLSSAVIGSDALFGFGDKRFKYEGLINAGSLGLDLIEGQVAAWGDWNGDQFLDAIVLDSTGTTVAVHLWDHAKFAFDAVPTATVRTLSQGRITNVIAADLNYDGRLDLLLMSQDDSRYATELRMDVYLGKADASGFESTPLAVPSSTLAQPISIDAYGDMQMDLLGVPFSSSSSSGSDLRVWRNLLAEPSSNGTAAFDLIDAPLLDATKAPACKLANPHSSAFVDLNGDCLADLFLVCSGSSGLTYQIWTAVKPDSSGQGSGFELASSGPLPQGTGALSFGDIDRDGTIDVIFPTCDRSGSNCYLNVAFNRQVPLCSLTTEGLFGGGPGFGSLSMTKRDNHSSSAVSGRADSADTVTQRSGLRCRDPENLCVADDGFRLDFTVSKDNADLLRVPIEKLTGDDRVLLTDNLGPATVVLPNAFQLGDFNKDGHPDLTIITIPNKRSTGGSNNLQGLGETRTHVLRNLPCSQVPSSEKAGLGCIDSHPEGRTFVKVTTGTGMVDMLTDVRSVSWVDVDEDGTLDLMLQRIPSVSDGKDGGRRVTFVQNNYFHDSFFLKAMTLNGACQSFCEPRLAPKFRPWGTNYGGASYKFTVLDPNGVRRAQQVGQLPQTAYRSLLTPYSYFGLGRTNNYVESLFIGSTRRQPRHFLAVEGIIPNSQVVINPWQGGSPSRDATAEQGDPSTWTKQLYLHPGDWIPWVTAVLITTIVGLAIVVIVLHVNERREDEKERKRALHAINFDAL
ncbi:hypothetical protein BCV70DRAFT_198810 [Testicularia cyperi]|uniref:T-cell immunomodulatory protein TIP C2 domain-containing protein n=1 Tax=Testicularia cyperi TaxID=1882483 RepID=A0A317XVH5_9BASI|nr:hypothetical protein BCV70DRAFT_198810 [Testicularia cyperi]